MKLHICTHTVRKLKNGQDNLKPLSMVCTTSMLVIADIFHVSDAPLPIMKQSPHSNRTVKKVLFAKK